MIDALIAALIILCAIQAVRVSRLLTAALWLAGCSAMTALLLYRLGAAEIAVIELSVGAGLVTVLFVFAINMIGDEQTRTVPAVPRWVAWVLVLISFGLLAYINLPLLTSILPEGAGTANASTTIWNDRLLDVLLQIVLVFSGVLGVISLIQDTGKKEVHS